MTCSLKSLLRRAFSFPKAIAQTYEVASAIDYLSSFCYLTGYQPAVQVIAAYTPWRMADGGVRGPGPERSAGGTAGTARGLRCEPPPKGFDQHPLTCRRLSSSRPGVSGAAGKRPIEASMCKKCTWWLQWVFSKPTFISVMIGNIA